MPGFTFPEPATQATISDARRHLALQRDSVEDISQKIQEAEQNLARIVEESRCAIQELEREKVAAEESVAAALAYLSPIRRLPDEILRHIFLFNFEEYPCCAWVLAAVSSLWRRLVLSMPRLWSRIRLVTTQDASADTIRLWLERSGRTISLDIEIFLHFPQNSQSSNSPSRRRRSSAGGFPVVEAFADPVWGAAPPPPPPGAIGPGLGTTATYIHIAHPGGGLVPTAMPLAVQYDDLPPLAAAERVTPQSGRSKGSMHWGHIAFYYLTEQMHRWERFVFRFDKQFHSISALKSIVGDTPLLREFEVSCAEQGFYGDWPWLPCANPSNSSSRPKMRSLTLQHVPFKWSAPIFQNLQTLSLRTLHTTRIALDRVLYVITASPGLLDLSLHVATVDQAVLPLTLTTLPDLKNLSISGHYLLTNLVDSLALPCLETLSFDVDARDPAEDTILSLVSRSNNPPLTNLNISYGGPATSNTGIYYGTGTLIANWNFLSDLDHLKTLHVGGTPFEPLVTMLAAPDDDGQQDRWLCPNLVSLRMRGCHAHHDAAAKLVQMVESRNPDIMAGATPIQVAGITPTKLKILEVHECTPLGVDVISWLKSRVNEVICSEPVYEGSPRSPSYQYL